MTSNQAQPSNMIRAGKKGILMMTGALIWFVVELLLVTLGYSTDSPGRRSVLVETGSALLLIVPQICYLISLPALYETGVINRKLPVRLAQGAIIVYTLPFLVALLMQTGVSGAGKNPLLLLLPLGLVLIAVSMTVVGISVRKARVWTDWRQYMPFVVGWFPVGLMLPLAAIYGKPDYILVAVWGLTWFLLGLAIHKTYARAIRRSPFQISR